jgi:hypothetical protein
MNRKCPACKNGVLCDDCALEREPAWVLKDCSVCCSCLLLLLLLFIAFVEGCVRG